MPLIGAHMSIAGGIQKALWRGKKAGCQVVQIFTQSPSRWTSGPLKAEEIAAFENARQETGIEPVSVHDSYLINLASPKRSLRRKSIGALSLELERTEALRIPWLVIHPGSHVGAGETTGLKHISESLNRVFDHSPKTRVKILLETTAGQGTNLGNRLEHLAEIIDGTECRDRLGICLDTCHIFAAGYDIREESSYRNLIRSFDSTLGLDKLKLFHINDSKRELGSRIDRHEHPGHGFIGEKAFSFFLMDTAFQNLPFILETPKGKNSRGIDWDVENLMLLQSIMGRPGLPRSGKGVV